MMAPFGHSDLALSMYLNDLQASATTPLSSQREVELSARIQQGDLEARDELVRANLRFVIDIAAQYEGRGLSLAERISAGNLGLITAAERFDGTKGFKFITYAVWWIRQSIVQTIAEEARTVRLPTNRIDLLYRISRATARLGQDGARPPHAAEIAAELQVPVVAVLETLRTGGRCVSLDEPVLSGGDPRSLLDMVADETQPSPDAQIGRDLVRQQLERALSSLDAREKRIIRCYFGLDGQPGTTLEHIGTQLGLTRERVRQIKERALTKLRRSSRSSALREMAAEVDSGR
jgi:RNA polymerase primary sigma factor